MAFLDKLSTMAKNAADKTSEMMEVTKLNSKINESKSKIAAHKTQVGEHYWAKYESGETLDSEVMELCTKIRAENDMIEELNREILKIKAVPPPAQGNEAFGGPASAACVSCGGAIPDGKRFCPECGAPVAQPESEPQNASCPSCGKPVSAGKKFCPECGAPVSAQ